MTTKALIFGVAGQDGSYLADQLVAEGCEVHGVYRRTSNHPDSLWRIDHLRKGDVPNFCLYPGDITDPGSVWRLIDDVQPDEIYNFADQDEVGYSGLTPEYTMRVTATAPVTILEAVRHLNPDIRVFLPTSATIFGDAPAPQNENTPLAPQSPYAVAKATVLLAARHYRREHKMFVATAIYYNHDSPRRRGSYLLQKICRQAVEMSLGKRDNLVLGGNLRAKVDIGYAPEYTSLATKIVRANRADDFVIGTYQPCTIEGLALDALHAAGYRPGEREYPFLVSDGLTILVPNLFPDVSKVCRWFGWEPKVYGRKLVEILVKSLKEELGNGGSGKAKAAPQ